jgi:hypothetical protein
VFIDSIWSAAIAAESYDGIDAVLSAVPESQYRATAFNAIE